MIIVKLNRLLLDLRFDGNCVRHKIRRRKIIWSNAKQKCIVRSKMTAQSFYFILIFISIYLLGWLLPLIRRTHTHTNIQQFYDSIIIFQTYTTAKNVAWRRCSMVKWISLETIKLNETRSSLSCLVSVRRVCFGASLICQNFRLGLDATSFIDEWRFLPP